MSEQTTTDDPKVVEWVPDEQVTPAPIRRKEWDGTRTRLTVARNVRRGDFDDQGKPLPPRLVGRGEKIDFRAAYDPDTKRWYGPEADHVEELIAMGNIMGTRRQAEVDAEVHNIEVERGVYGGGDNGAPLRPDLRASGPDDRDALYNVLRRAGGRNYVEGTLEEIIRAEHQDSRQGDTAHADAIRELAAALREGRQQADTDPAAFIRTLTDEQAQALVQALTARAPSQPLDNDGEWPGAQAPGTHVSARRRRAQRAEQPVEAEPPAVEE